MTAPPPPSAAALALLLACLPAAAQPQAPGQGQGQGQVTAEDTGAGTTPSDPAAPTDPAEAPPSPARLATGPLRANIPMLPDLPLAPGFTKLPIGGWRITGRAGKGEQDHAARMAIETIGRYLAERTTGRVTVIAQVSGPADDPSIARRTSLARAVAVKGALTGGGLPGTRIDIRPMGRTPEARDALDIIAPPAPPPKDQPPPPAPEPPPIPPPPPEPAPRAGRANAAPARPAQSPAQRRANSPANPNAAPGGGPSR